MPKTLQIELPDELFDALVLLARTADVPTEQLAAEWLGVLASASLDPSPGMFEAPGVLRVPRRKKQGAGRGAGNTARDSVPEAVSKAPSVYQLKVTLKRSKPPIWRRLLVPGDVSLARLHTILQIAFGWSNSHLHQFIVGDVYYGKPDPDWNPFLGPETRSEKRARLKHVVPSEGSKFIYEYDFGDGWEHEVLVEKIMPPDPEVRYPVCIKGKRACPPDDVGGIWGYEAFLEAIKNPDNPEHEYMLEWIGGSFDPEEFDQARINEMLGTLR